MHEKKEHHSFHTYNHEKEGHKTIKTPTRKCKSTWILHVEECEEKVKHVF